MHLNNEIPREGFSAVKLLTIVKCSNRAKPNEELRFDGNYLTISFRVYFSFSLTIYTK